MKLREHLIPSTQKDFLQDTLRLSKVNDKRRVLKAASEKSMITYKGMPIRLSADFSEETLEEWNDILKILKDKNC